MTALAFILALFVGAAFAAAWAIATAPEGFETDEGFFFGKTATPRVTASRASGAEDQLFHATGVGHV
jgi:hypothetical protein